MSNQLGQYNTQIASLQRGKISPNESLEYDTKHSDGEAPVMIVPCLTITIKKLCTYVEGICLKQN